MSYRSVFAPGLLAGQVVVVTGGGSGIGRCTAHELAALGAQVVLVGRNPDKLRAVQDEIAADGGQASHAVCDIRQEAAVQQTVADIVARHGAIDGLVNNAGGQYITPVEKISAKGWQAVVDTNLTGGFLVARECFVQSMQACGGAIVNIIADIWGSMPGMAHSGAARAGMVSLTETSAAEWAKSGVRVNAVAPGIVETPFHERYSDQAYLDAMRSTIPLQRLAQPDDMVGPYLFLASAALSGYMIGQVLEVNGGQLMT